MTPPDFVALENIEYNAFADFYRAAPEELREAYAIGVREAGMATCLIALGLEPASIFRRAVGLGVGRAATRTDLDEVFAAMNASGERYVVTVAPRSKPAALSSWLEQRGFSPGYPWMKFHRPCEGALQAPCDLEIRVIGSELALDYGRVITEGFELPPALAPWIGQLAGRANWVCLMAFAGAAPVAGAAVYISGEYAWFGFGTTLPSHRRRGAQFALLARRLSEAAERGARVAVTETGERQPDKPNISYRNILKAGFKESYLRQNYLSPE